MFQYSEWKNYDFHFRKKIIASYRAIAFNDRNFDTVRQFALEKEPFTNYQLSYVFDYKYVATANIYIIYVNVRVNNCHGALNDNF